VDLYQLHRVDANVPLAESWGALAELVDEGKVLWIVLSEVNVAQIKTAQAIHPVTTVQSELSLWTRDPLPEVLPYCAEQGIGFLPFSPLGRGFLTGKLDASTSFGSDDFRSNLPRFQADAMAANQAIVDKVRAVAARVGAAPGQVALAWVIAQGEHVVPIPGTKRLAYLEENAAAADLELPADVLAELDALPAPVGARYGAAVSAAISSNQ
jgi:aryl-alcohol dehydrogenase-like predicted oxidoreductase